MAVSTPDLQTSARERDPQALGHLRYQGPSLPRAQFGRAASSGCSKLLPLRALEPLMQENVCSLPQTCAPTQFCLRALQAVPLTSWLGFSSDKQSAVNPYIDRCGPFQTVSNLLNIPQVDSSKGPVNISNIS